jgi:hypothetical protein
MTAALTGRPAPPAAPYGGPLRRLRAVTAAADGGDADASSGDAGDASAAADADADSDAGEAWPDAGVQFAVAAAAGTTAAAGAAAARAAPHQVWPPANLRLGPSNPRPPRVWAAAHLRPEASSAGGAATPLNSEDGSPANGSGAPAAPVPAIAADEAAVPGGANPFAGSDGAPLLSRDGGAASPSGRRTRFWPMGTVPPHWWDDVRGTALRWGAAGLLGAAALSLALSSRPRRGASAYSGWSYSLCASPDAAAAEARQWGGAPAGGAAKAAARAKEDGGLLEAASDWVVGRCGAGLGRVAAALETTAARNGPRAALRCKKGSGGGGRGRGRAAVVSSNSSARAGVRQRCEAPKCAPLPGARGARLPPPRAAYNLQQLSTAHVLVKILVLSMCGLVRGGGSFASPIRMPEAQHELQPPAGPSGWGDARSPAASPT